MVGRAKRSQEMSVARERCTISQDNGQGLAMPRMDEKLSLKAFWNTVEQRLAACSAEELRAIVRALAQATPPTAWPAFLDAIQPAAVTTMVARPESAPDALLADIAALTDELQAATKGADGGDEDDEEDRLGPYEEFVEPLTALFDRVVAVFEAGNVTLVRTAYHNLFTTLCLEDDYGRGMRPAHLHDVDMGPALARYLRAVYDTEAPAHRSAVLFEAMLQGRSWLSGTRPKLADIIQIAPQPLPDREQFCRDWIAFLRTQSSHDADAWLREAVRLSQGTLGLEALARTEGVQRPRVYLDWCAALAAEGKPQAVLAAAHEALQALPEHLPIRAAVADYLCAAATHLHDTEALRVGCWEALVAQPTLARLLDVWETTSTDTEKTRRMRLAADQVQHALAHPPAEVDASLGGCAREPGVACQIRPGARLPARRQLGCGTPARRP